MKTDLHLHTPYCGHADGSAEATVQAAIRKGFDLIGFSEHFPYPEAYQEPIPDCVASRDQWPDYLEEIEGLQRAYQDRIRIRIGVEIDYLPGLMETTRSLLQAYPYDYIYGSVHLIDNIGVDYQEAYLSEHLEALGGPDDLWEKYWNALESLIKLEMVDMLSHLDLPRKLRSGQPTRDQTDRMRHILELMRDHGLALELNTGGIDRSVAKEAYPSLSILKHARKLGLEITFGSDAHAPEQVGRHHEQAMELLRSLGWKRLVIFKNRKKEYSPIHP